MPDRHERIFKGGTTVGSALVQGAKTLKLEAYFVCKRGGHQTREIKWSLVYVMVDE